MVENFEEGGQGTRDTRGKRTETLNGKTDEPHIISWNITLQCPVKCSHCYVDAGDEEVAGVLSTQEAFGVIDQIRKTGTSVVVLSGGGCRVHAHAAEGDFFDEDPFYFVEQL